MICSGCTRAQEAAFKTLDSLGYTYKGGELWQPPLGKPPNFNLIDLLESWIADLKLSVIRREDIKLRPSNLLPLLIMAKEEILNHKSVK